MIALPQITNILFYFSLCVCVVGVVVGVVLSLSSGFSSVVDKGGGSAGALDN